MTSFRWDLFDESDVHEVRSFDDRRTVMDLNLFPVLSKDAHADRTFTVHEIEKGEGETAKRRCSNVSLPLCETKICGTDAFSIAAARIKPPSSCIASLPPVLCLHLKRFTWKRRHAHQADERRRFPVGGLRFSALLLRRETRRARRTETPVSTGKRSRRTPRSRASALHHPPTSSTSSPSSRITADMRAATTAACRELDRRGGSWQHFNDDDVNSLTTDEVRTGQGYIFMYAQIVNARTARTAHV